jgi:PEGA domain
VRVQKLSAGNGSQTSQVSAAPEPDQLDAIGTVIFNEPLGAEILVDHKLVGNVPATLQLPAGEHEFVIRRDGAADWIRFIKVLKGSQVTLKPSP